MCHNRKTINIHFKHHRALVHLSIIVFNFIFHILLGNVFIYVAFSPSYTTHFNAMMQLHTQTFINLFCEIQIQCDNNSIHTRWTKTPTTYDLGAWNFYYFVWCHLLGNNYQQDCSRSKWVRQYVKPTGTLKDRSL